MARAKKHGRVTEDELAALTGRTVRTIRRHADKATIVRGPDGLYDRELAVTALAGVGHDPRPKKPAAGEPDWKLVLAREQALKARLERQLLQGKLILRSAAEEADAELAALLRSHLDGIGGDLQDELAAEDDPRKCKDLVDNAIRAALNAAADTEDALEDAEGDE